MARQSLRTLCMAAGVGVFLVGCGGGSGGTAPAPVSNPPAPTPTPTPALPPPGPGPGAVAQGFKALPEADWDETAVAKVLHTFAYGGLATHSQLATWAGMSPENAVVQMLSFDEHNEKLAPLAQDNADGLAGRSGSLRALTDFFVSADAANGVREDLREFYDFPGLVWGRAVQSRGLNPVRQKIGFWETNDHMAVNLLTGVTTNQIIRFYDTIMGGHAAGDSYDTVIGNAALSAAVAFQYGYFANVYVGGQCFCNEDFARELHQLYFGILGDYDTDYHETVAIKNTAAALTDVRLGFDPANDEAGAEVTFGSEFHPDDSLDILHASIGGQNARERMDGLVGVAIAHPESLDNLPVKIVRGLADDNLDADKIAEIRDVWRSMPEKNLLAFLRAYAISAQFHSPDRVKYLTSVERLMLLANKATHSNAEGYTEIYTPFDLEVEGVIPFAPAHNVFGSQTGLEAAASAAVFRNNYNRVTSEAWRYRLSFFDAAGIYIDKRWNEVIPADVTDNYRVDRLAQWLWEHYLADGLKHYGPLERAHLHAILARDRDLVLVAERDRVAQAGGNPDDLASLDLERIVNVEEVTNGGALVPLIDSLGAEHVALAAADAVGRHGANARLGQAINFIAGTPYLFALEGR